MDYKEKYEQGLECLEEILNSGQEKIKMTLLKERLLPFFPELEREDEKMRKKCINFLNLHKRFHAFSAEIDECITWLENQKATDKEIIFRALPGTDIIVAAKQALEKIEIGKEVVLAFNGAYIPVNGKTVAEICNEYFSWVEKQGEQKPAEKVEPKFHKGEWLCENEPNNYARFIQILEIVNVQGKERYRISRDLHNDEDVVECRFIENNYHSFNIQDAKDGDVLYSLDSKQPFIFKHRKPNEQAEAYCGLNIYGKFFVWGTKDCVITLSNYIPATKKQRELLFKKMKEAGYQWNPDTKELKKVEQKPVNDTVETIVEAVSNTSILDMIEDKDAFTNPGVFENSLGRLLKLFEKLPKQDLLDGLKFYTNVVEHDGEYVKPATWSEEDETGLMNTIIMLKEGASLHFNKKYITKAVEWLKSLKERLI